MFQSVTPTERPLDTFPTYSPQIWVRGIKSSSACILRRWKQAPAALHVCSCPVFTSVCSGHPHRCSTGPTKSQTSSTPPSCSTSQTLSSGFSPKRDSGKKGNRHWVSQNVDVCILWPSERASVQQLSRKADLATRHAVFSFIWLFVLASYCHVSPDTSRHQTTFSGG